MGTLNVGQEILNQLKMLAMQDLMCWGASSYIALKENQVIDKHNGGLIFKVNGMIHKGHVMVTLRNDLYDIRIGKFTKTTGIFKVKGEATEQIYAEDLARAIDDLVEGYYKKGSSIYKGVNLFKGV